jgi:hypothetical protein
MPGDFPPEQDKVKMQIHRPDESGRGSEILYQNSTASLVGAEYEKATVKFIRRTVLQG